MRPGFLRESDANKLRKSLSIVEYRENPIIPGGKYPHHVAWLEDENNCGLCGAAKDDPIHSPDAFGALVSSGTPSATKCHAWVASKNEVSRLHRRMDGLVHVLTHRDTTGIPDLRYEVIKVTPTPDMLRAAQAIRKVSARAIQALTLLRELSDGFQYADEVIGEEVCSNCSGKRQIPQFVPVQVPHDGVSVNTDLSIDSIEGIQEFMPVGDVEYAERLTDCFGCGGSGSVPIVQRQSLIVGSPKEQALIDELDANSDTGRYIVWGGFTQTIDSVVAICHAQGWATLRVDGRGYSGLSSTGDVLNTDVLLDAMDRSCGLCKVIPCRHKLALSRDIPRLCFVGHPKAGGMALTLTAALTMLFYSNSFDGEARMQAVGRHHRIGMDTHWGGNVKDLVCLPTDLLVLNNLKRKIRLQGLTLGHLDAAFRD